MSNFRTDSKATNIPAGGIPFTTSESSAYTYDSNLTYSETNEVLSVGRVQETVSLQTLTGAGAVNITSKTTAIVTTSADALTLADGVEGQEKFIFMKTDGGDGTLTPSNLGNGTTITFDDAGDTAHLLFSDGSWWMIAGTATLA